MTPSSKPPVSMHLCQTGAKKKRGPSDRPSAPAGFVKTPEAMRILEEMIFNDVFQEEFAGKTLMVGLDEAAAIRMTKALPFIGTSTLTSCFGIALYDPEAKVGAVAHINLTPEDPNLAHVAKMLQRTIEVANLVGGKNYAMYSFNGSSEQRGWNEQLSGFLAEQAGALIAAGTISGFERRDEHNFVLDTRSGAIFTAKVD